VKTVLASNDADGAGKRLAYSMLETAELLGVSYITVHRLVKRGLLKSSTALRHKLIPLTEIQRFLRETT
jgi:excisionase family DNA binding protein